MAHTFSSLIRQIFSEIKQPPQNAFRQKSLFRRKSKNETELSPFIILRATKEDFRPILEVMHQCYFPYEPTSQALGINHNAVLDEHAMRAMAEGMTLVARCKYDGCIVGGCINESAHEWDAEMREKLACTIQCPKVKQMLLFNSYVQSFPNLWKTYEVNKIFEITDVFVMPTFRRKGICSRLLQQSKELASDFGFHLVRCDATSQYTAQVCEKLKMKLIAEIPYPSYLGKNLEPVFNTPFPHEAVKIYIDDSPHIVTPIHQNEKSNEEEACP